MIFSKYIVEHFDLSNEVGPIGDALDAARYCVFWYGSVPLGEVYLPVGVRPASRGFWEACAKAISPALEKYQAQRNANADAPIEVQADGFQIRRVCRTLLSHLEPSRIHECDVSVVVCSRDRANFLRKCLSCLAKQYVTPREIIVIDNGSSTDETRLAANEANVRYIREDIPGLDVARNTGARAARGSIVAYTDDDTQPDPYWVYRISEVFEDARVAGMTGLVLTASLDTEAQVIFEKFWPFNRGYLEKTFDEKFFRASLSSGPPVWEIGAGANMAFRKSVFDEIGYFDERLDVGAAGCSGDSELWYRMLACGLSIRYCPLAVVYHCHRPSMPGLQKQLHAYMRGFTVAILIQHQRFGHRGNLQHLFRVLPPYYLRLIKRGFPHYHFQYKTLLSELSGIASGLLYYLRHRHTDPKIYQR